MDCLKNTTYNIKTWKKTQPIKTGKEIGKRIV